MIQDNLSKKMPISALTKSTTKTIIKQNKKPKGELNISNSVSNVIDVINVSKTYVTGNVLYTAIHDVNLQIKKGEFVVIVGPSGSGKTTLLNVLSGLDRATSGDIIVENLNISALSNKQLTNFRKDKIGFVFQSYNLIPELNAHDNALLGQVLQKDVKLRLDIKTLFEQVDLNGKENNSIGQLSGGQAQRVSIVRALAKNPSIIFADEPTGALDSRTSDMVLKLLKYINKEYNTTIILVTHNNEIEKIADKVIEVKDGVIAIKHASII